MRDTTVNMAITDEFPGCSLTPHLGKRKLWKQGRVTQQQILDNAQITSQFCYGNRLRLEQSSQSQMFSTQCGLTDVGSRCMLHPIAVHASIDSHIKTLPDPKCADIVLGEFLLLRL